MVLTNISKKTCLQRGFEFFLFFSNNELYGKMQNSQGNQIKSGPTLELKGSIYVQKGHPNMVTQVDMILQNW